MRTTLMLSASIFALAAICFAAGDEVVPQPSNKTVPRSTKAPVADPVAKTAVAKAPEKSGTKLADKAAVKPAGKASAQDPAAAAPPGDKNSADEAAIRKTADTFAQAYADGDAQSVAAHYTADAEYVDEHGNVFQGRQAIEDLLTAFFAANPGSQIELAIDTIRFVSPGVAVEDGMTTVVRQAGHPTDRCRYTAVHVKTNGKWLTATARDHAPKDRRRHAEQLKQLDWLLGDWVDEADDSIVEFSCQPLANGNFLFREFTVKIAGEAALSGQQRIGWDALTGKLRAWTFDSEGGSSEGTWHRDGDSWILKSTGVTADGQTASGTSIFTYVNGHTLTWQGVDHEIDGEPIPDSELFTLVRTPPKPTVVEEPLAAK
jgi:uncharacterized protein (TIGR02246 family)